MDNRQYKVSFLTLGCRVNQYESDTVSALLEKAGCITVPFGEKCDAAVINTCTVTAESDRKSRQMIRRAASFSDHVIVTGCYAQSEPGDVALMEKVSYVCGNGGKASLAGYVMDILDGTYTGPVNCVTPPVSRSSVEFVLEKPMRTRSYIKIEDGCDNKCAYCLIHSARGPVRSKKPDMVLEEVRQLSKHTHEVILTGIETASYGMDFENRLPYGYALADLIEEVNRIDTVKRIGLGSLDPTVMSDYFVSKIRNCEKVLPHFHLSIQSGSSGVLASMRRKYNRETALRAINRMKEAIPGVTFSCDIIVGFPGESDSDFNDTVAFCREVRFLHPHIFPYSKRKGTEASLMKDQVPENIKHMRAADLEKTGASIKSDLLREYTDSHSRESGSPVYVLAEKSRGGVTKGHSEHFVEVKISDCTAEVGEIIPVFLERSDGEYCYGTAAFRSACNSEKIVK